VANKIRFQICLDTSQPASCLGVSDETEIGVRFLELVLILAAMGLGVVCGGPELAVVTQFIRLAIPGDTYRSVARRNASPATCPWGAGTRFLVAAVLVSLAVASRRRVASWAASIVALLTAMTILAVLSWFRAIAGVMTGFYTVEALARVILIDLQMVRAVDGAIHLTVNK
jgi:hypothetical protein